METVQRIDVTLKAGADRNQSLHALRDLAGPCGGIVRESADVFLSDRDQLENGFLMLGRGPAIMAIYKEATSGSLRDDMFCVELPVGRVREFLKALREQGDAFVGSVSEPFVTIASRIHLPAERACRA